VTDFALGVIAIVTYAPKVGAGALQVATQCTIFFAQALDVCLQGVIERLQIAADDLIAVSLGKDERGEACKDVGREVLQPGVAYLATKRCMRDDCHALVELPRIEFVVPDNLRPATSDGGPRLVAQLHLVLLVRRGLHACWRWLGLGVFFVLGGLLI
jgi:hypothetical protein